MQAAVFEALSNSSALATAMGGTARIFDKVPDGATYPYLRIGDDQSIDDSNSCSDGWEVYVTVHIFSQHASGPRPDVKAIGKAVAAALVDENAPLTPTGFSLNLAQYQGMRPPFFEADGITVHGVLTCRYLVGEA